MPSVKPRLALTLPEHRHDLLKRLAALQGVSMASVVTELLEECYPVLERVVVALEAAKHASESARTGIRESCDKAIEELEPYRLAVSDQFDLFMDGLARQIAVGASDLSEARAAREAAAPTAPGALNPRVVTRGSGSQPPLPSSKSKKAAKPDGKGVSK